jgi:two-component system NtrC family sensor kinase
VRGDIKVAIDIARDIWPVAVDLHELELALVNLVVNSRDAMPEGGTVKITAKNVRLRPEDTPERLRGEFVALMVIDTGCGIDTDVLPKVFEPFFTTKQPDKGTGLGLSQVYGLARQSGGTATIWSEPGSGTIVTLYLPRSRNPVSDQPVAEEEAPRGGETVLLVEDNPDVRDVTVMLLEELGYRVLFAPSADAALQLLASGEAVDLVFTDVVMPGELDGIALARRVKEEYPEIAVLLTTGYARAASIRDAGFPILRKPYQISTLAIAIRDALDTEPARLLT